MARASVANVLVGVGTVGSSLVSWPSRCWMLDVGVATPEAYGGGEGMFAAVSLG